MVIIDHLWKLPFSDLLELWTDLCMHVDGHASSNEQTGMRENATKNISIAYFNSKEVI